MPRPRHNAVCSLIAAISRQPASWSYMMKSAPAPAKICGKPGLLHSRTMTPKTVSPLSRRSRTGLERMHSSFDVGGRSRMICRGGEPVTLLLLDVPHHGYRHFQQAGKVAAVGDRLEELTEWDDRDELRDLALNL